MDEKKKTEVEPFNSATDHYQKIMGMPNKRADLQSMPRWIRWFYYFVVGFVLCALIMMLYLKFFY